MADCPYPIPQLPQGYDPNEWVNGRRIPPMPPMQDKGDTAMSRKEPTPPPNRLPAAETTAKPPPPPPPPLARRGARQPVNQIWIVGQWKDDGPWVFRGAFDCPVKAEAACIHPTYFVGPICLNEMLPHGAVVWPGVWYPKVEKAVDAIVKPEPPLPPPSSRR